MRSNVADEPGPCKLTSNPYVLESAGDLEALAHDKEQMINESYLREGRHFHVK